jgi:hypothetical protein
LRDERYGRQPKRSLALSKSVQAEMLGANNVDGWQSFNLQGIQRARNLVLVLK